MLSGFLAEIHRDDVRPVLAGHLGAIIVGLVVRLGRFAVVGDLELQPEIDRWIDEGGDRRIGNGQDRGCLVERQADAEMIVRDRQVPVARSEEHTSELQSLMRISYAVFCLKKKK